MTGKQKDKAEEPREEAAPAVSGYGAFVGVSPEYRDPNNRNAHLTQADVDHMEAHGLKTDLQAHRENALAKAKADAAASGYPDEVVEAKAEKKAEAKKSVEAEKVAVSETPAAPPAPKADADKDEDKNKLIGT